MEDSRLNMGSLYGGGSKSIPKTEKTKTRSKSYSPKKNSFSHYDASEDNEKDKSPEEQWRKQNRILQAELNATKKALEEKERANADLKRQLELLQQ
jgi:hypothetical protein